MSNILTSQHAKKRMQQRGIKESDLLNIYLYADTIFPVGKGCSAIRFSKKMVRKLEKAGLIRNLHKLKNMVVIIDDLNLVVTVFIDYGKKDGRRYRKP